MVVQSISRVQLFVTPWTVAPQASLSFTIYWSLLKLMSTESVMPPNHLILGHPLLLSSIFPNIRFFFHWVGFSHQVASDFPKNTQGWFTSGLTGLISLLSKGLSRVFSQLKSINSLGLSLIYGLTLTSICYYWKNHSFDYTDLCWQTDVFGF